MRLPNCGGMDPSSLLCEIMRERKLLQLPMDSGMLPDRLLKEKSRFWRRTRSPNCSEMSPLREFSLSFSSCSSTQAESSCGMGPIKLQLVSCKLWRWISCPTVAGITPPSGFLERSKETKDVRLAKKSAEMFPLNWLSLRSKFCSCELDDRFNAVEMSRQREKLRRNGTVEMVFGSIKEGKIVQRSKRRRIW